MTELPCDCKLERSSPEENPYSYVRCVKCNARGPSASADLNIHAWEHRADRRHFFKGDAGLCWLCGLERGGLHYER